MNIFICIECKSFFKYTFPHPLSLCVSLTAATQKRNMFNSTMYEHNPLK